MNVKQRAAVIAAATGVVIAGAGAAPVAMAAPSCDTSVTTCNPQTSDSGEANPQTQQTSPAPKADGNTPHTSPTPPKSDPANPSTSDSADTDGNPQTSGSKKPKPNTGAPNPDAAPNPDTQQPRTAPSAAQPPQQSTPQGDWQGEPSAPSQTPSPDGTPRTGSSKGKPKPAPPRRDQLPAPSEAPGAPYATANVVITGTPYVSGPTKDNPNVHLGWTDGVPPLPAAPKLPNLGFTPPPPPVAINILPVAPRAGLTGKAPQIDVFLKPPLAHKPGPVGKHRR